MRVEYAGNRRFVASLNCRWGSFFLRSSEIFYNPIRVVYLTAVFNFLYGKEHYNVFCCLSLLPTIKISGTRCSYTKSAVHISFVHVWVARELSALGNDSCVLILLWLSRAVCVAVVSRLGFLWYSIHIEFHRAIKSCSTCFWYCFFSLLHEPRCDIGLWTSKIKTLPSCC